MMSIPIRSNRIVRSRRKNGREPRRQPEEHAVHLRPFEVSEAGKTCLREGLGWQAAPVAHALNGADIVVLAVPETAIGKVAHEIEGRIRPGAMVIALGAAAPYAGHLPKRDDIACFLAYPCHPPTFNDETGTKAKLDRFGGVAAKQAIVCCLIAASAVRIT